MLRRDAAVLASALAAIGVLALLAHAAEPTLVPLADLATHEGDLVKVSGTVASEPLRGSALRFHLRDTSGSARVAWLLPRAELHQGDTVAAVGRVAWIRGAVELQASAVTQLAAADAPLVRLGELANDPQRIVMVLVGVEAFAEPGERMGQATLHDAADTHRLEARVPAEWPLDQWSAWPGRLLFDEGRMRYVFEGRA